jgi:uncharacterized membrane protein
MQRQRSPKPECVRLIPSTCAGEDAMNKVCIALIGVLLASGCARGDPLAGTRGEGAATPVPAPVQDAQTPLPGSFEVFTREPTWHVRVDAASGMVLDGPAGHRELRIETSEPMFDGRNVVARDATGTVEVRITPRLCEDAAGAMLAYTARVSVEGVTPVLGCGRPLD